MRKVHTKYVCQSCAYESARWAGKCPSCGEWNTYVEEIVRETTKKRRHTDLIVNASAPVSILDVQSEPERRLSTRMPEFDRVLGGGIVAGSVVLVGGDPGIGKSTLMMQMACSLTDRVILYITGEESINQMKLRFERLGAKPSKRLLVLSETNVHVLDALMEKTSPDIVIVDSIQTMFRPELESSPGTVSQVREATAMFMRFAKTRNIPVFLIGHVTKEGVIAGPRVVEHMVDTVLQFEGERHYSYRIVRALKNRFGSTNEIGIFEMSDTGLREVQNPSEAFLAERKFGASGSVVVASMEGTRPILLEVQALVAPAGYGVPQRTAKGFDTKRLLILLAVLERRVGLHTGQFDVFINVPGGVQIDEPAVDLGIALAIVSSLRNLPADPDAVAVGEIGLGGEIRTVTRIDQRVTEARKLGFKRLILPRNNYNKGMHSDGGIEVIHVETVDEAISMLVATS